jgi:hypothetical protein
MGYLKDTIIAGKESALSSAIKKLSEKYISRFGHIQSIEIDSSTRSLTAEVLLKGELEPITLKIKGFEIIHEGERHLIIPHSVSASRHWIDTALKDFLQGRAFDVPAVVAKALKFLV